MNGKDFLKEANDYLSDCYKEFQKYQEITHDILKEFDRVCSDNHLEYWIAYGTLLGAVRDGNQIPWDYDVDVVVKVSQKDRLLQILNSCLGEDYYYDFFDKNKTYPTTCIRVCKKGYSMMALHVDVFFLIGLPEEEIARKKFHKEMEKVVMLRNAKYVRKYLGDANSGKLMRYLKKIKNIYAQLIPRRWLEYKEDIIQEKYKIDNSHYCVAFAVGSEIYPSNLFSGTLQIQYGEDKFPIPSGYEDFLNIQYGDYKKYASIQDRFEEFYSFYKIVGERQKLYEQQQAAK